MERLVWATRTNQTSHTEVEKLRSSYHVTLQANAADKKPYRAVKGEAHDKVQYRLGFQTNDGVGDAICSVDSRRHVESSHGV